MTEPPYMARAALIMCGAHGGADLSVRVAEYVDIRKHDDGTERRRAMVRFGRVMVFPTDSLLEAAGNGWLEVTKDEGRGVVCRPAGAGLDWLTAYTDRTLARTER